MSKLLGCIACGNYLLQQAYANNLAPHNLPLYLRDHLRCEYCGAIMLKTMIKVENINRVILIDVTAEMQSYYKEPIWK